MASTDLRERLGKGLAIPAMPLALDANRKLDERRQRALLRYYQAAGAGGLAVGVHTTQFAIRDPKIGLFKPVLQLGAEALRVPVSGTKLVGVAGLCGATVQAVAEAALARDLGYEAGLLSLGAMKNADEDQLISHCRAVAEVIPLFGFYLQSAVGGRVLAYAFWRRFAEIENVVAIKIAPFNRYQTLDVVRAVAEAGRDDIALYTGNDDSIVTDLLTPFRFQAGTHYVERRIVGGLLGHWAVWTRKAVELHARCRAVAQSGQPIPAELLRLGAEITDA
ncbi:MAG TPA: dihydrodipicolinate synthase family protein, partial [Candidatus Sulfotelmatobacter sp.]|nr:dihydrodipicolinate synthase family protein [Candidatus Sulfotelmatobacter sp.]